MKIYTKTGDAGETALLGGVRVEKSCMEMEAIGEVDELNAGIGFLITLVDHKLIEEKKLLEQIQHKLFHIGGMLAAVQTDRIQVPTINAKDVECLEQWIDTMQKQLPELTQFILPGGSKDAAQAFLTRAVCRRAERRVVELAKKIPIDPLVGQYVNRLSDLLFVLGRFLNCKADKKESVWIK